MIYARSFSKTVSGSLRVGLVACSRSLANQLADIKMLTSITSSQFTERLVYLMLVDGHYRKYLARLQERLGEARISVTRAFERMGFELFVEPSDGIFVWARLPDIEGFGCAHEGRRTPHRPGTRHALPSPSRPVALDAVQRGGLR